MNRSHCVWILHILKYAQRKYHCWRERKLIIMNILSPHCIDIRKSTHSSEQERKRKSENWNSKKIIFSIEWSECSLFPFTKRNEFLWRKSICNNTHRTFVVMHRNIGNKQVQTGTFKIVCQRLVCEFCGILLGFRCLFSHFTPHAVATFFWCHWAEIKEIRINYHLDSHKTGKMFEIPPVDDHRS